MAARSNLKQYAAPASGSVRFETSYSDGIWRFAELDCPILLVGEKGTGKQRLAEDIHRASPRSHGAFHPLHAAAVNKAGLRAALTGSATVYIAALDELDPELQVMLVEFCRRSPNASQARVLAGSNAALLEAVKTRSFREDLFYLLGQMTIQLTPLRHRKQELAPLAESFLGDFAQQFGRSKPVLSERMLEFIMSYAWPGNVSELETAMKTLAAIGDESIALAAMRARSAEARLSRDETRIPLKQASRAASLRAERELISEVLGSNGWNRKQAARELKISYKALLYKLKQIGMVGPKPAVHDGESL
jgi:two-component system response regulator AtoC